MVGDIGQPHAFTLCYVLCLYVRISSYRCMLVITLLLHMLYVICYCYFTMRLWYDIIDITRLLHMIYVVLLVLHGNSGRAVAAI